MITRFALFEGSIHAGQTEAFRAAVLAEVQPKWLAFPGALAVRICFADARDDGAPEIPMILAIDYPDLATMHAALATPERQAAKDATEALLPRFFTGRIHHHVTVAHQTAL